MISTRISQDEIKAETLEPYLKYLIDAHIIRVVKEALIKSLHASNISRVSHEDLKYRLRGYRIVVAASRISYTRISLNGVITKRFNN